MYSGITVLAQALCSNSASASALTRDSRDRPDPVSITMSTARSPSFAVNQARTASRAASAVPAPLICRPSVRNSCCAITLLLYLLMSRTTSASGGDATSKLGRVVGAGPSRTLPVSAPPASRHRASIRRAL